MKVYKYKGQTIIDADYKVIDKDNLSCDTSEVGIDWYEVCYRIVWCAVTGITFGWVYDMLLGW